ncbi:hypothetical protein WNY37_06225 [Henriciella sp. AS95]|uniref:hypothetical protein n=1 Tax=Henriciella sp. AS95 TaxID=3135782 RepID=UPI00317218A6
MRSSLLLASVLAGFALAACGGGDSDAEPSETTTTKAPSASSETAAAASGRVVTEIADVDAKGTRRETFESAAILRCAYDLSDERFVFEEDTANVIEASFTLTRTGQCESDDDLDARVTGMDTDQVLPSTISVKTTGINFKEKDMTPETGDTVLKAEFTAAGKTSPNELACRSYTQRGALGISCDLDGVRLESHELPATEGSGREEIRITLQGKPQF